MDSSYNKAIDRYYYYKRKYNEEREKQKLKIKTNDNLSLDQKREKIKQIKPKCLFCKRKVGMQFFKKKGMLYALCGNTEEECGKKMVIKTSQHLQLVDSMEYFQSEVRKAMEDIVNHKTKLLLSMGNDKDILEAFEEDLENYDETSEIKNRLESRLNSLSLNQHIEEVERSDPEMKEHIKSIQVVLLEYEKSDQKDAKLLTESNKIYAEHIRPLENKINELSFRRRVLKQEKDVYTFHKLEMEYHDTEIIADLEDPEVIEDVR